MGYIDVVKERIFNKKVCLYPMGSVAKLTMDIIRNYGIEIDFFSDSNPVLWGTEYRGKKCVPKEKLIGMNQDELIVMVESIYYKEIKRELEGHGVKNIVRIFPEKILTDKYMEKYGDRLDGYVNEIMELCADERSRQVFQHLINAWKMEDIPGDYFESIYEKEQYFDSQIIKRNEDEVFVDAGAYIGDTAEKFLKFCDNKYEKIHLFELDPEIYQKMESNVRNLKGEVEKSKINCYPYGLSDENKEVRFLRGDRNSTIGESFDTCGNVRKMDDILHNEKVTFIKMDIEGSEMSALVGASDIIRRQKPKLAICIYHSPEDMFEIPRYIKKLVPEYNIYIRHYTDMMLETVCYATISEERSNKDLVNIYIQDYKKEYIYRTKGIILYGAGVWGKIVCETLQSWGIVPIYFVDRFREGKYCGIDIITNDDLGKYRDCDILICAPSAYEEIKEVLQKLEFKQAYHVLSILQEANIKTFSNLQDYLPREILVEIFSYYMNRNVVSDKVIAIPQMSFSVTEACSLKCEKCNALVPYYRQPVTFKFEEYLYAMNRLLDTVDKIIELAFIGGEPLLNQDLYKYLEWAIQSEKICSILVVTNSTILPDVKLIKYLKNRKVVLCLDDYGKLSNKLFELEEMAVREGINYFIQKSEYWFDFSGNGLHENNYTEKDRKKVFLNCPIRDCNFFLKGRVYRCQYSGNLINLGICKTGQKDFVDFNDDRMEESELKQRLKKLITSRVALESCDYCTDVEERGKIPVAVQVSKGEERDR